MEQIYSINFSSLIASFLLHKNKVSSVELVNYCSKIESEFDVEIVDDDIEYLFECVDMDYDSSFCIRSNLDYESVLPCGKTVYDFLKENSLPVIINSKIFCDEEGSIGKVSVINTNSNKSLFRKNKRLLLKRA